MNPEKFLKTIYLGDRACKKIIIDSWNKRFCLQVNLISKLKENSLTWDYYSDEDIENGWLIFEGMTSVSFSPPGYLPNDLIERIDVRKENEKYVFTIFLDSGNESGLSTQICIQIIADHIYIESNQSLLHTLSIS